jgi:hypothetical protein
MSELTQCNYCSLHAIRQRAQREKKKVTINPDVDYSLGGTNVYVHPKDVKITKDNHEKYFVSWMMEVGDHCGC